MKIQFTTRSKSDIAEIVELVSQDNPQTARNLANSLFTSIKQLIDFPEIGRVVPEYSEETIREIIFSQYRIVYKINKFNQEIYIITVYHSRRLLI